MLGIRPRAENDLKVSLGSHSAKGLCEGTGSLAALLS
jgi:hypothetical protein